MEGKNRTRLNQHVGRRVRRLRLLHKMSTRDLARIVQMNESELCDCEAGEGRFGAARLQRIASHFLVPPQYFFEDFDAKNLFEDEKAKDKK